MADRGWVLNPGERRWELRGPDGERVLGWLTLELVTRAGQPVIDDVAARRRWPRLVPGVSWWQCVLAGGPCDGRFEYLDPAGYPELPLFLYASQDPRPVYVAAPALPAAAEALMVYERAEQPCGHGRACPYPYRFTPGGPS